MSDHIEAIIAGLENCCAECADHAEHIAYAINEHAEVIITTPADDAAHDAAVAAKAWAEGYDEGLQRGIGLERTGHLTTRRHELGPVSLNPYEREGASHE